MCGVRSRSLMATCRGTGPPCWPWRCWGHDAVHDRPGAVRVLALEAGAGEDRPGAAAETPQAHRPVAAGVGRREDRWHVSLLPARPFGSVALALTSDSFALLWLPTLCISQQSRRRCCVSPVSRAYERISFSCLRVSWVWLIQAGLSAVSLAGLGFLIQVELSSAPCLSILVPRPRRQPLGKRWS